MWLFSVWSYQILILIKNCLGLLKYVWKKTKIVLYHKFSSKSTGFSIADFHSKTLATIFVNLGWRFLKKIYLLFRLSTRRSVCIHCSTNCLLNNSLRLWTNIIKTTRMSYHQVCSEKHGQKCQGWMSRKSLCVLNSDLRPRVYKE